MSNYETDINKAYISPYDKFFHDFDKTHEPSLSQRTEIRIYALLGKLRDFARPQDKIDKIWRDF